MMRPAQITFTVGGAAARLASMPNDPRALLAVGTLTAVVQDDRDAFLEISSEFAEPTEAVGALLRLSEALVKMLDDALEVDRFEAWLAAASISAWD